MGREWSGGKVKPRKFYNRSAASKQEMFFSLDWVQAYEGYGGI